MANVGSLVGGGIAAVMMLVSAVIISSVENATTWSQSLSSTIGNYIEPLAILATFAIVGMLGYRAFQK